VRGGGRRGAVSGVAGVAAEPDAATTPEKRRGLAAATCGFGARPCSCSADQRSSSRCASVFSRSSNASSIMGARIDCAFFDCSVRCSPTFLSFSNPFENEARLAAAQSSRTAHPPCMLQSERAALAVYALCSPIIDR